MSEHRSTAEAYLSSTNSSDLRVQADVRTDADRLLAAAYAVMGDPRRILALKVYRLRAIGDMGGARQVADELGDLVRRFTVSTRGGYLRGNGPGLLQGVTAADIAMQVIKWFHMPACPACGGRGHPMLENAPVMDLTRECPECYGTGIIPLERIIRPEHVAHARWLANEMDGLSSLVFSDMAKLLKNEMDGL